jgi:hypothetical protein
MALSGFDSPTVTISQSKSPKAEVTEPLTGIYTNMNAFKVTEILNTK